MSVNSVFVGLLIGLCTLLLLYWTQGEIPTCRGWITKNVPVSRIDHLSTQGRLHGVWQVSVTAVRGMRLWGNWPPPRRTAWNTFALTILRTA